MADQTPNQNPSQPKSSRHNIISMEASFSGPLPHPSILRGYEDACPGAADRIIGMAEQQGNHRRALEDKAAEAAIEDMRRGYMITHAGQLCALVVALALIGGGVYVACHGSPGWGTAMGGGGILGGVALQGMISAFMRTDKAAKESKPQEQTKAVQRKRNK